MEKSCFYPEQKSFLKYDSSHIIGYLNEEIVENFIPQGSPEGEDPEPWPVAYKYTGTETDGGTIMECRDPEDYGEVANAIIRSRYSVSQEMAIHRHAQNGDYEGDSEEYDEYNDWCAKAVRLAKKWLSHDQK